MMDPEKVRRLRESLEHRCAMLDGKVNMNQGELDQIREHLADYEILLRGPRDAAV